MYTIKDTTLFASEYLTRVSDFSQAVKGTTEFARERLPRVIDYSRALLGILYVHSDSCVPRVLEDNSRVFFKICRGTKENTRAIVNLAVGCIVATNKSGCHHNNECNILAYICGQCC